MKTQNVNLFNFSKRMLSIVLMVFSLTLISCDNDDDDVIMQSNIVEIAQSDSNLSTLVDAVVAANLATTLSSEGPFTVFAPTNAAFAKLDPAVLSNIVNTPELLSALLQYHVVSGSVLGSQLPEGSVPTLLNGQTISVDIDGNIIQLNGNAKVIAAYIQASNGIVHVIDEVLIPEDFNALTIVQIASSNPNFSILVDILSKPEMADLLSAANDISTDLTVFAPTNTAFNSLLDALGKDSIDDLPIDLLKEIVQYHIIGSAVLSSELSNGEVATLLPNESVMVTVDSSVKINDANVVTADIKAINGVVHVVDKVLLPSFVSNAVGKISEVVLFNTDYTILAAALRKAELLETVSTAENLTVFAPNNDAFVAAGVTSLDGLSKEALTPILLYHVLGQKVMSTQLPADGMVTTLNNDEKMYLGYLTNGVVLINGLTQITAVDIEKMNGVIHTIDRTLIPPAIDVVDIAIALANNGDESEFTVLVSLLASSTYANVTTALKEADNVTVFAPTDAAFDEIASVIPTLTEDQITKVLTYHAVGARVFSTDLSDGQVVSTLNSETFTVNIANGSVSITDMSGGDNANVLEVNIQGSNGVIHVIDKVLLPTL